MKEPRGSETDSRERRRTGGREDEPEDTERDPAPAREFEDLVTDSRTRRTSMDMDSRHEGVRYGVARLRERGVDYGDVRSVVTRRESLTVRNGVLDPAVRGADAGFGVRVLCEGAWGFAASHEESQASMEETITRAVAVARASALARKEAVRLAPAEPQRGTYRSPRRKDPFRVSLTDKLDILVRSVDLMRRQKSVVSAEASLDFFETQKILCTTEGTDVVQEILESGGGIAATAEVDGEVQRRSYPNSFRGNFRSAGYEFVEAIDLPGNAVRIAEEAEALCRAPDCPSGVTTLVVDADQMALQVHESCGHPTELDRVLGTEISLAGGSFMGVEGRGRLRYGSERVHLTADSTTPGGLGSFGWDDEGISAGRTPLVEGGIHVGYLTSRETAPLIGLGASGGTMRAESWAHVPLIRMVNVNLEPGEGTLEEIVSEVTEGIYVATNKSWSIDDLRLNFQFGCELAREIRKGKLGRLYKNPVYTGITPRFWGGCTAVGGAESWLLTGITSCGKGEPMQVMHVSHGAPPARFERVEVGVSK
jgi:TldD protein